MSKIQELLQADLHNVGIAGHVRPDGDCIGAVLSVAGYIGAVRPDLTVDVYLESVPERFSPAPGVHIIQTEAADREYDLFFAVDCGDADRLGKFRPLFDRAKDTVCIDHHISNEGFAAHNFIEPEIGSSCEILYTMMDPEYIREDTAACLYMGIAHDTGVFQYSNTTPRTLRIAAQLLEYGFDHTKLIRDTFFQKTYIQTQVLGRALMESILIFDGRCAVSVMKQKEMKFYGVGADSMEGIVNQLQQIQGIELAIFLYEIEEKVFKVSMRSNEIVDVSKVARIFGGGGHVRAAGCVINGTFHEVINNLTLHIQHQLEDGKL